MRVNYSHGRDCEIHLGRGTLDLSDPTLADVVGRRRGLLVLDANLEAAYGHAVRRYLAAHLPEVSVLALRFSERTKSIQTVLEVCSAAQRTGLGRRDPLLAVGGGVCCDVVSVAATLIRRGIPYVTVPTTLLAQIDAGIALKGGVNFSGQKNYLGCFRSPSDVVIDPAFLGTVETAELRSGMAEAVKIALVRDAGLFRLIRRSGPDLLRSRFQQDPHVGDQLIERAVGLMLQELVANPYEERSLERLADFGHTFSGSVEEASGYTVRHGEAVAIDIALSTALATELGLLDAADGDEVLATILTLGLPLSSHHLTDAVAAEAMRATEAHRGGHLNLVVPTGIGTAGFIRERADLPEGALARARRRVEAFEKGAVRPSPGVLVRRPAGELRPVSR